MKRKSFTISSILILLIYFSSALIGQSNPCATDVLDFSAPNIDWAINATDGDFSLQNLDINVGMDDADEIFIDSEEINSGIQFGIDPVNESQVLDITYTLSNPVNFIQFDIVDLDLKSGPGSNQQEAVTVTGYLGSSEVLPTLSSLEGSVAINGNYAEATTNSALSGDAESILVNFDQCIDRIVISYGTGTNSPVADPTYSKIQIGKDFGIDVQTCAPGCTADPSCTVDENLNFTNTGFDWANNTTSNTYAINNLDVDIQVVDTENIFIDSEEFGEGIQIGIDPDNTSQTLSILYSFSESINFASFKINDLDLKAFGAGSSNQQEAVTVIGYSGSIEIMPTISSFDGSVNINGNYAEATANSANGSEESITVEFDACIDQIEIIYGTGNNSPVADPTYSKIQIGAEFGMSLKSCAPGCIVPGCTAVDA